MIIMHEGLGFEFLFILMHMHYVFRIVYFIAFYLLHGPLIYINIKVLFPLFLFYIKIHLLATIHFSVITSYSVRCGVN